MAKPLDSFTSFDEDEPEEEGPRVPRPSRIDNEALQRRTDMFISMTQGRGKPMIYGAGKKDKK